MLTPRERCTVASGSEVSPARARGRFLGQTLAHNLITIIHTDEASTEGRCCAAEVRLCKYERMYATMQLKQRCVLHPLDSGLAESLQRERNLAVYARSVGSWLARLEK